MRKALLILLLLAASGCWTPKGTYTWVDEYRAENRVRDYLIQPGDILAVKVFAQENLSTPRVRVRSDGKVSLPMVNDVTAQGMSPYSFAQVLQVKLKNFINNPVVTVSLEETRPLSGSVVGEVMRVGVHPLEPGSGVMQALAAAGGFNDFAHENGIFVLRPQGGNAPPARIRFTYDALKRGEGAASGFLLMPGDTVVVE
jgi:polysaccharide export outer membrane protein